MLNSTVTLLSLKWWCQKERGDFIKNETKKVELICLIVSDCITKLSLLAVAVAVAVPCLIY
jgi:hypothetical protein